MNPYLSIKFLVNRYIAEKRRNKRLECFKQSILSQGWWFIDIPRTGSTSLKQRLGGVNSKHYCREKYGSTQEIIPDHMSYYEIESFIGKHNCKNLKFFSIVRDPFTRIRSIYKFRILNGEMEVSVKFRDFVLGLLSPRFEICDSIASSKQLRLQQVSYLCNSKGEIRVDYLGRFEERAKFIKLLQRELNINFEDDLHLENSTSFSSEEDMDFTEDMVKAVETYYKDDFELLDYEKQLK